MKELLKLNRKLEIENKRKIKKKKETIIQNYLNIYELKE